MEGTLPDLLSGVQLRPLQRVAGGVRAVALPASASHGQRRSGRPHSRVVVSPRRAIRSGRPVLLQLLVPSVPCPLSLVPFPLRAPKGASPSRPYLAVGAPQVEDALI